MAANFFLSKPMNEQSGVDVIVRANGMRYKKAIGISVKSKFWMPDHQRARVTKQYPHGAAVNHKVEEWKDGIEYVLKDVYKTSGKMPADEFWGRVEARIKNIPYTASKEASVYFTDYFEFTYIPRFRSKKSEERIRRFHVILAKVKAFESYAKRRFTFNEIDLRFYRDIQGYMESLNHAPNYFGNVIKIIKQVMTEAHKIDRLHSNSKYLHSSFKSVNQDVDTIYLTELELKRIHETPIDEKFIAQFYPRLVPARILQVIRSYNIAKNRFLIGAYTGLRISDFNRITQENILGGTIKVITEKTDQKVVIPIHPVVQDIIDSGFNMEDSLSEAKTNLYIKDICNYVKIHDRVERVEERGGKSEVKVFRSINWSAAIRPGVHSQRTHTWPGFR